jgi:hypothetical protein
MAVQPACAAAVVLPTLICSLDKRIKEVVQSIVEQSSLCQMLDAVKPAAPRDGRPVDSIALAPPPADNEAERRRWNDGMLTAIA